MLWAVWTTLLLAVVSLVSCALVAGIGIVDRWLDDIIAEIGDAAGFQLRRFFLPRGSQLYGRRHKFHPTARQRAQEAASTCTVGSTIPPVERSRGYRGWLPLFYPGDAAQWLHLLSDLVRLEKG